MPTAASTEEEAEGHLLIWVIVENSQRGGRIWIKANASVLERAVFTIFIT